MTGVTPKPDLDTPVYPQRDYFLGPDDAPVMLLRYGSYACPNCRAANAVIEDL